MSLSPFLKVALLIPLSAFSQDLQQPPSFSRTTLVPACEEVRTAWVAWKASNKDLEGQVFSISMTEARDRIQRAFSDLLAFVDKRRTYNEAVLRALGNSPVVGADSVNADQLELLGVTLSVIQKKLDTLRTAPDWIRIRRAVQVSRSELLKLQDARRQEIENDRPLSRSAQSSTRPVSSIVYGDSERQSLEAVQKLWTRYYQALIDSVERKPGGSTPLAAKSEAVSAPAAPGQENPLTGTWTYADGSQQFNGVAEPKQVILELWMEKGFLVGRYRAELRDFDGIRHVDISLRGKAVPGKTQTLEFPQEGGQGNGKILLQGPGPSGIDLMLIRSVEAGGAIPRGRELLSRR